MTEIETQEHKLSLVSDEKPAIGAVAGPEGIAVIDALMAQNLCPECAAEGIVKEAKTKGGLAKHRSQAHGVLSQRGRKKSGTTKAVRMPRIPKVKESFDSKKLLQQFFPNGMPLDSSVMQESLDLAQHAEQLWNRTTQYRKS